MATKTQQRDAAAAAVETLREILPPGTRVYTVLRHRAASGMSRRISTVLPIQHDGRLGIRDISYLVARALGERRHPDDGGIIVSGAGMDMGFDLVYHLGRVLYPAGFDLAPGQRGRNGDMSGHDDDGGYALDHEWL